MAWVLNNEESFVFKLPFTTYMVGPTGCGKTQLLSQILLNKDGLFNKKVDKIVFCFNVWQSSYEVFKLLEIDVEFFEGLYDLKNFDKTKVNLLIIDDLMEFCKDNKEIQNLFSVDSHHKNISVFLISQNIFIKGKCARDINLNSSNLIIFNNPRDRIQIGIVGRQMLGNGKSKAFMEIFNDATDKEGGHGYLFLDFKQETRQRMRIQTNIIPSKIERSIIYTINK